MPSVFLVLFVFLVVPVLIVVVTIIVALVAIASLGTDGGAAGPADAGPDQLTRAATHALADGRATERPVATPSNT